MAKYLRKEARVSKIVNEVLFYEKRLDMIDQEIRTTSTRVNDYLKKASELKTACRSYDKVNCPDKIEEMEEKEMYFHIISMDLSAYFVERSRLVRLMMQKNAKIRELKKEMLDEEGEIDYEEDNEDESMDTVYAKVAICMNKTSALEEHVKKQGKRETARILKPSPKAPIDYDELARWMWPTAGGRDAFNTWYHNKNTFPEESSDEGDSS